MPLDAATARRILTPLERTAVILAAAVGDDPAVMRRALRGGHWIEVTAEGGPDIGYRTNSAPSQGALYWALVSARRKLEAAARRPVRVEPEKPRTWRPGGKRVTVPAEATRPPKEEDDMAEVDQPDAEEREPEETAPPETWEERTRREALEERDRLTGQLAALMSKRDRVDKVIVAAGGEIPEPAGPVSKQVEDLVDLEHPPEEPASEPEEPVAEGGGEPEPDGGEPEDNGDFPEHLRYLPAANGGGPRTPRVRVAERQHRIMEAARMAKTVIAPELAPLLPDIPPPQIGDQLRALSRCEPPLLKVVGQRALKQGNRPAVEYAVVGEGDASPEREPTPEEVRDRVVKRAGVFGVGDVAGELGAARAAVSAHFELLEARGVIEEVPEEDRWGGYAEEPIYRYVTRAPGQDPPRRREPPPELELVDRSERPAGQGRGRSRRKEHRGWTNNKDVNKLLLRARKEDHALVEYLSAAGHVRVRFPNGATVRVGSTPPQKAIKWIEQDLEHARHGRFDQIVNGGLGAAEQMAVGSAPETT